MVPGTAHSEGRAAGRPSTVVYIATTVDGCIARPDGGIDWLDHDSLGEDYGWADFRAGIDGLVMGRNTFAAVQAMGVDWPYAGLAVTVWSRTMTDADLPTTLREQGVRARSGSPADLLAELRERGASRVWVDGGATVQAFLAAGLVDTLTLTRLPVLIGAGLPLFGALPADVALAHQATRAFASGVTQSTYEVVGAR